MKYDGVTFVEARVREMSKADFIKMHIDVLWLDRDKPTRKKMLADIWQRIVGKDNNE